MISGGQYGILNNRTLGTLSNSGAISGRSVGLYNDSTMGTLTNGGTISSNTYGIVNGGTIDTLSNTGTISGLYAGIANHGTLGTLSNSGTIRGGAFAIRSTSAGATIGPITNSGVISGNIQIDNQNVTLTGGSGSTFGTLTNGTFTVSHASLNFAGGNTKLDQNIVVNGGSGTVTNAGTLALDNRHAIIGNFIQTGDGSLDIGIAGTSLGNYGHLDITGAASLAGGLGLHLLGSFTLAEGQTFDLLNFASSSGDFTSLSLNGIACTSAGVDDWSCSNMNGYIDLKLSYAGSGTELDLVVGHQVPEPAPLGLFTTALAALGLIRRRKTA